MLESLPHINASLNALAAVLLVVGYVLIKRRRERAHKWTMIACFGVSIVFLVCYLGYHELLRRTTGEHGKPFANPNPVIRWTYFTILISHIILAASVPFSFVVFAKPVATADSTRSSRVGSGSSWHGRCKGSG